jgi:phosphatidylglycerol:prolipoprotein diacylglycerol transferase
MIGFPGIGYGFEHNPIIFRIGENFALTWYALLLVSGLLLAVMYCLRQTKHFGIKQDEVYDVLFCAVPAAIVGARLYYVAFNWGQYRNDPITILYTWHGGMAIYGCIIGAVTAAVIFCRLRRINTGAMLDLGAMGLLIGQAVGRWGNFVNGEIYGASTDLPWRMRVNNQDVHPLFLYESLWNIIGLVLLRFLMKKRRYNGQMFTVYVAWYGLGRAMMEGMRHADFNLMLGNIMFSRLFAAVTCIAAFILLFYMTLFKKHPPLLEWTEARDEYDELRKARKNPAASGEDHEEQSGIETGTDEASEDMAAESGTEEPGVSAESETEEEEAADDGNLDGREEPGAGDEE